ncbi:protein serine/threonine phosphatase [Methanohalobium evestigatum Z-7303]|uniref:Protein serine/threonine phosphatase n=1 Tax=Methanohalobium evestigatum (strain ATCC BAA-1072 / DSM 3721 / NBRC 107634 / OCM 161 / Z-7303) TaxID=644295 RepID=D7E682_METEZ|nr:protein serine/threonine phosphatase [Methanohalobium evestigatum Z-7303]
MLAVADGVGGNNAGEVASNLAVHEITNMMYSYPVGEMETEDVINFLKVAHQKVREVINKESVGEKVGMDTTLVSSVIKDDIAVIANTGDSKAFVIDKGGNVKLKTKEHTYPQYLFDEGIINKDDVKNHPLNNMLTCSITGNFTVDTYKVDLISGDSIILTSDGIHDYIYKEDIISSIKDNIFGNNPREVVAEISEKAFMSSKDNFTVLLYKH